ncbi:unnamed protein product [Schistocephalus solidus]|uniref:Uncharacterized protein n=1 Tax=Schistocephalus solidus TaxID=70667 RepID=A0A183TND1_SCHSO|nr:unnamed protein product [Schistocephalus solidus]
MVHGTLATRAHVLQHTPERAAVCMRPLPGWDRETDSPLLLCPWPHLSLCPMDMGKAVDPTNLVEGRGGLLTERAHASWLIRFV